MAFYAYGLLRLPPEEAVPQIKGIDSTPVFGFRCEKYTMLVSRLEKNFRPSPRAFAEHWQVIARAFESHTVLPMRYGTVFRSEMQIFELIRQNRQEMVEAFCRLRGKAEMRLKVLIGAPAAPAPSGKASGTDRKPPRKTTSPNGNSSLTGAGAQDQPPCDPRSQQMAEQAAARLQAMLKPLDQHIVSHRMEGPQCQVELVHLIEMQNAPAYQRLSQALLEASQNVDLRLSGPWPPYHFMPIKIKFPKASLSMSRPSLRTVPRALARALAR